MFQPTKTHLALVVCGVSVVAGATYLHAQNSYPAPAATPEAAAQDFYQLLDTIVAAANGDSSDSAVYYSLPNILGDSSANPAFEGASAASFFPGFGAVSRAQVQAIEKSSSRGTPLGLIEVLIYLREQTQYQTRVADTKGNQTIVEISPDVSRKREVVTIAEDGGYRVDLKATLGRWGDLSGEKLDLKWFELTNIAAPSLLDNPTFIKGREDARRSSCQSNLKQQMLGIIQYSQDYDEKMPPARKWIDVLQPYIKSEQVFICPSLQATGVKGNGYAFNQYLSQKSQSRVQDITSTVAIYETSNPARNWFGPGTGRAYRHAGGSNIAFADGHIKWFLKGQEKGVKFKPNFG